MEIAQSTNTKASLHKENYNLILSFNEVFGYLRLLPDNSDAKRRISQPLASEMQIVFIDRNLLL